jgi:hypothetical protein
MKSVLVLGGYGNFGRRIVAALAYEPECRVFVCGRSLEKAALCRAGSGRLRDAARRGRGGVLVVSGASSLPALSSAVVDELLPRFSAVDTIEHGITAGAKPPGRATMRGTLAYAGKAFTRWHAGEWRNVYGWQGLTRRRYPSPAGARWIADCDVPDLELFPVRYRARGSVRFRAGVSPAPSMFAVWLGAGLVRLGILPTLSSCEPLLHHAVRRLARFGPTCSAMHVTVRGIAADDGAPLACTWSLVAEHDHGPLIPSFPAVALARKILRNEVTARGAMPCMGFLTVEEILRVVEGLDLHVRCDA